MDLRTLGTLALEGSTFTRPKPLILLSYLALEGTQTRQQAADVLFSQAGDGLSSLRTTIRRLRSEAPDTLEVKRHLLRTTVMCDAQALLAHLDAHDLQAGVDLYTGAFLADVTLPDWSVELENWVYSTREFIAQRVRGALLTLAERQAAQGQFGPAAALAERAAWLPGAPDPEREDLSTLRLLLTAGKSPLLSRLEQLEREYGASWTVSTDEARARLLRPPTAVSSWVSSGPQQPLTSFVGRQTERAELARTLDRPEVRLLTLMGPGGIGKTRLALEVVAAASSHQELVFVSLETLPSSLELLPGAVAQALRVPLRPDLPPFEALLAILEGRSTLLLLDSAEHLLDGASYLSRLLRACPALKVMVTSRERIGLTEEWVMPLSGLDLAAPGLPFDDALRQESVALFAQRARRAKLTFRLTPADLPAVRQICQLVDGSPLGLELAAAWVRVLPIKEIASELRRSLDFLQATDQDVPPRHHSLRAIFDQSVERLTRSERQTLAQLSVFGGGFDREAALAVAGATLMTLARFVDKSLVRTALSGCYDLHVLLHQFTSELLARDTALEASTRQRRRDHVLAFCRRASEALRESSDEGAWTARLDQQLDNLRISLREWLDLGDIETLLTCLNTLRPYWARVGRTREALEWYTLALRLGAPLRPELREQALAVSGELSYYQGQWTEAEQYLRAALLSRDARGAPSPLQHLHLGMTLFASGNLSGALTEYETALDGFTESGQTNGVAAALNNLGEIHQKLGNVASALQCYQQALKAKQASGGDLDTVLLNLGALARGSGDHAAAQNYLRQAFEGIMHRNFVLLILPTLEELACLAWDLRRPVRAAVLLGATEAQRHRQAGDQAPPGQAELAAVTAQVRENLGEDAFAARRAEGSEMTSDQLVQFVLSDDSVRGDNMPSETAVVL
ncbi:tetratricopeptide repeat protein [Deinococcus altitudinis]|uniref:tetratricopeptide repeat protein n=1 Tax=Deinococcus altitudinis TaxID=468914 RepID=UPI003892B000